MTSATLEAPSQARASQSQIVRALFEPVDGASLAVFRMLFGSLMAFGLIRVMASGWIDILYGRPSYFFKYYGFAWVQVLPQWGMFALYSMTALMALGVALGCCYRFSCGLFLLGFTAIQLMDVTNYLNHYYLVILLSFLLLLAPAAQCWSLDAWRRGDKQQTIPALWVYLFRFQFATVYFFAGLAKVHPDWLIHAQPMGIWMASRTDTPIIGGLLAQGWMVYALSWAGCAYDLTIALWLSLDKTRTLAWFVVLVFHGLTNVFFDIGLFPFMMTIGSLLFFSFSWPRRYSAWLFGSAEAPELEESTAPRQWSRSQTLLVCGLGLYVAFQLLFPLRYLLYPGDVLWGEQGMRFSWRVMIREKNGSITYRLRKRGQQREWYVNAKDYLRWRQYKELSGQPDLILQLAQHIAADARRRGLGDVEVRVDALVSLNGRRSQLMIDPTVDLTQIQDGLMPADWITPAPTEPPLAVRLR